MTDEMPITRRQFRGLMRRLFVDGTNSIPSGDFESKLEEIEKIFYKQQPFKFTKENVTKQVAALKRSINNSSVFDKETKIEVIDRITNYLL